MSNHNIFLTLHFDEKLVFFCNFKNSSHFQEKGHFTDVELIGTNGQVCKAHGAVLLRHCPQLRMIAAKFACCYCHGTDCGGCERNSNLMSLSLPDFATCTIMSFLELLYIGRTFFQDVQEYEKVVELGKHLGFAVPASGLSLVQEELPSTSIPSAKSASKRPSIGTPEDQPVRKKSRSNPDEPMLESPLSNDWYHCSSCDKKFGSKYLRKKHFKEMHEENPGGLSLENKKQCEICHEYFPLSGGWFTKHLKTCEAMNNDDDTIDIEEAKIETIETEEQESSSTCPKCGKVYAPHVLRHLKDHIGKSFCCFFFAIAIFSAISEMFRYSVFFDISIFSAILVLCITKA